jgi:hypothetical protein
VAHFAGTRKLAFTIRTSKIQGKGAFATRRIAKGARIIEYLGECIDEAEADIRYPDDEMGRHHTFLFSIGDGDRVLDAGPLDWPAKYINHSCDPNCEAIEEEDGRVFISALRNIAEGAELLYDYAYERTAEHTAEDEKLYVCRCGSPKCRGTIMAPPKPVKTGKAKKDKRKKKERKAEKRERKEALRKQNPDGHAGHIEQHAAKQAAKKAAKHAAKKAVKHAAKKAAGTHDEASDAPAAAKKAAAKKGGAKKGAVKKGAVKKGAVKKGAVKKGAVKKGGVKKSAGTQGTKGAT